MELPAGIQRIIGERPFTADSIGMSNANIFCFEDMVLKIEDQGEEQERGLTMMSWLKGKLPVPEILWAETVRGKSYLLMSRAEGEMLCEFLDRPERLVELLAQGLRMLWAVDAESCPCPNFLEQKLREAEFSVVNHLCDTEHVEPDTYGTGGFRSPEHLLEWLKQNKPPETPRLTHGDFCLPNIFASGGGVSCFIDLGRSGLADPYQDIAICYRSLKHNLEGAYGGKPVDFDPNRLFDELGLRPDWDLMRYYTLLDELF